MASGETITTNAAELAARINKLAARLTDPSPALERARQLLIRNETEVWATSGGALGARWAAAAEPDRKVDSRLLVASGALRASLTGSGAGSVHRTTLEFGTSVPYGVFHQYGIPGRLPAREFLGVAPNVAREILRLLEQAIADEVA